MKASREWTRLEFGHDPRLEELANGAGTWESASPEQFDEAFGEGAFLALIGQKNNNDKEKAHGGERADPAGQIGEGRQT